MFIFSYEYICLANVNFLYSFSYDYIIDFFNMEVEKINSSIDIGYIVDNFVLLNSVGSYEPKS